MIDPTAAYRMIVTSSRSHAETAALAARELRAWLASEGFQPPSSTLAPQVPSVPVHRAGDRTGARPSRGEEDSPCGEAVRYRVGPAATLDVGSGGSGGPGGSGSAPLVLPALATVPVLETVPAGAAGRRETAVLTVPAQSPPVRAGAVPGRGAASSAAVGTLLAPAPVPEAGPSSGTGSAHVRWRLREVLPRGVRRTMLTVATAPGGPTWVRLDAEHLPNDRSVRPDRLPAPGLAARLLDVLEATDGLARVQAGPRVVQPEDVDAVVDELCDPDRRLPVVVASTPYGASFQRWFDRTLDSLLTSLTGLAVTYALTPAAQRAFNCILEHQPVFGGAVRTYLPGVDPASRSDGDRHPVMSRRTIEDDPRRAAGILACEPRRLAESTPVPEPLAALPALRVRPDAGPADPHPSRANGLERSRTAKPSFGGMRSGSGPEGRTRMDPLAHVRELLHGSGRTAGQRARRGRDSAAGEAGGSGRRPGSRRALAGNRDALLRRLRGGGRSAAAEAGDAPATFDELLARLEEFPNLCFTGDPKATLELDDHGSNSTWVRQTWEGLQALQDYAEAAARGTAGGDFKQWCENPPADCHAFPPRKAVRGESHTVCSNAKWKRERMLPVPDTVDASGRVFMGAHLRIGGGGTSPRLHYHDDCSGTGSIYIGYIGLHLTNTRTN